MKDEVDEKNSLVEDFVQLARLGLAERPIELGMYLRKMLRRKGAYFPELTQQLLTLLRESPSNLSPLRQATGPVPVDADSKLQLLRVDAKPLLEVEPAFAPAVASRLNELVEERRRQDELLKIGMMPSKTAIFTGVPGVGKTYAAKWLAREFGLPLLTLDLSAVMSSYLGKTGANIRQVLNYAKSFNCILLLDEIDAIAKKRGDDADVGELKRLVTVLLQAIDEWPSGGLIIGATNHPELLDPAIWRRFEVQVSFPTPTGEALEAIFLRHLKDGRGEINSAWSTILSKALDGVTPSDVQQITNRAKRRAAIYEKSMEDVLIEVVRQALESRPHSDRVGVATTLVQSGIMSQRLVNELTGVSRDTIRKRTSRRD